MLKKLYRLYHSTRGDKMTSSEDRQALIDLIEWYRDEWHCKDFGHTRMINSIPVADEEALGLYWQITDQWLDY
jgi:hypothetical protein